MRTSRGRVSTALLALAACTCTAAPGPDLALHYDRPARGDDAGWEREALPIGNGRIGAMLFGQPGREHLQFNEMSLWTGDHRVMGAYQSFGDLRVDLPGRAAGASGCATGSG